MRSLVTGGSGFIGSNLVDALLARGDEVTVVDDLSTGRRENLDEALGAGAELVEADIRDGEAMADLAQQRKPELIFHLAAQIDVRRSVAEPDFDAVDQRRRDRQHARGGARSRARAASSSSPPAARSTARATESRCRSPRTPRRSRLPPTARASSPAEGYVVSI